MTRKHLKRIGVTVAAFGLGVSIGVFATRPRDPSEHEAVRRLLELKAPVYCGAGAEPLVALTFDDGPGPYSARLVDLLRRHGARATFFEIGNKAASHPDLVRAELSVGAVGDHSWSHPDLTQLEASAVTRQLASTQRTTESIGGRDVLVFGPRSRLPRVVASPRLLTSTRVWRDAAVSPGRAARPDAASSVAPIALLSRLPASLPRNEHRTPTTSDVPPIPP